MKIIGNARDLSTLDQALASFIRQISPWVDDEWNPEEIGYIFILGEEDVGLRNSVCIVPHVRVTNTRVFTMVSALVVSKKILRSYSGHLKQFELSGDIKITKYYGILNG